MSRDRKWASAEKKGLRGRRTGQESDGRPCAPATEGLCLRGIRRTQSGFVMLDERRETGLKVGLTGQECGASLSLTQKPQGRAGMRSDIVRHTAFKQQAIPIIQS